MGGRTGSPLPDLLRHDPKDREHLNHDLYDDVRHGCGRPNLHIFFKTLKKVFHATKKVNQSILAGANILNGLKEGVTTTHAGSRKMFTWRRIPIPVKIVFAGGNICDHTSEVVSIGSSSSCI
jgi:hypothetical protein